MCYNCVTLMSVQTADYLDLITRLPPGGRLTLYEIAWEEYEQLLDQLGDEYHFRISYDNGRLEIMTPTGKHERYKSLLHDLVTILSDELDLEILSYGSTTLKLKPKRKGAEGDDCFYIQRAAEIGEKDRLDLTRDPPPDLVIEIDVTHDSAGKFAIYAALGVPEIWRYDGSRFSIWQLTHETYTPTPFSLAFPFLTAEHLAEFVANSEAQGRKQARRTFRDWVRATKPGTP
jgi:Uma2 family endonuclease